MTYLSAVLRGFSCTIVLSGLSACTYLIPDEVSVPRYNSVLGDRHKPVRNTGATGAGASLETAPSGVPLAIAAPVVPVTVSALAVPIPSSIQYPSSVSMQETAPAVTNTAPVSTLRSLPLPPVDPAVEAKAKQLSAANGAGARQVPSENPGAAPVVVASGRHAPSENGSFQMAQNNSAQGLMDVPARPVLEGPDSATARLNEARRTLEQSRSETSAAKEQLNRDVIAEPSVFANPATVKPSAPEVLSPLPQTVAPAAGTPAPATRLAPKAVPNAAVTLPPPPAPLAKAPNAVSMQAMTVPTIALSSPAPLEAPAAAPVSAPRLAANTRVFDPMAVLPAPVPVAAAQPMQLTAPAAPVAAVAAPAAPARAVVAVAAQGDRTSSFDPLADAPVSSSASADSNLHYLTPSRYVYRR